MKYYVIEPIDPLDPTGKRGIKEFTDLMEAYLYQLKKEGREMMKVITVEAVEK